MYDNGSGVGTEKSEARAAGTCATCGRQLTQCGPNGECLRCLVSLGFLADGEQAERPAGRGRLTPGPLRYAHVEVEVGADGFPVELGAGAMAITYRARDTVLNSEVALKVIDRKVAQNPGARSRFLRDARAALVVKVIDYGVAKVMGLQAEPAAEQTQAGFIGTPAFASPEQFAGAEQSPIDTRSDIYSLGVTLWYLLSGRTPFVGRTMEEIRARQISELTLEQLRNLHLPGQVITLLKSMLA